jgi:hypothetical protein
MLPRAVRQWEKERQKRQAGIMRSDHKDMKFKCPWLRSREISVKMPNHISMPRLWGIYLCVYVRMRRINNAWFMPRKLNCNLHDSRLSRPMPVPTWTYSDISTSLSCSLFSFLVLRSKGARERQWAVFLFFVFAFMNLLSYT